MSGESEGSPLTSRAVGVSRTVRAGLAAACVALLGTGTAVASGPPAAPPGSEAVMPLSEVAPGQKGYGVSVFSGTTRERFEVEVLGVIRNLEPNVSRVLARLSGRGLESTGVIAGMSGSPVYIDGKLMGAVAYAWPFAKEAIAQITPIESMRDLDAGGGAIPAVGASSTPLDLAALLPQKADREALAKALERLQPRGGGGASPVAWNMAGFAPRTQELFAIGLGAVSPSGEAVPGTLSADLQPGDAVAAVLIDGDLRLAATGTVTDRLGEDVLAFGHPFYGLGPVDIPMAPAEVVAVIANQYSSFKISNFGEPIGAFAQDRLAGIRGRIGEEASTLPVTVKVDSGRGSDYQLRLARVPQLTPTLLAISLIGAQEAAAQTIGPLGLDLEASFDLGEAGTVELAQSFDGANAPAEAALHVLAFADFFLNNGFAPLDLRSVQVSVRQHPEPRTAALVGGYAERTELEPGEEVRLHLDLVPWRGEAVRRDLALRLPSDLPAGRYSLLVGDGVTLDGVRMSLEPAAPVRIDQALRLVRRFHSRRDLVALGLYAGDGLAVAGEVLPRLPGSMRAVWSAASSLSAVPLRLTLGQEHVEPLPFPVEGAVRIDLKVVRREPVTSGAGEGDAGEDAGAGRDAAPDETGAEAPGTAAPAASASDPS